MNHENEFALNHAVDYSTFVNSNSLAPDQYAHQPLCEELAMFIQNKTGTDRTLQQVWRDLIVLRKKSVFRLKGRSRRCSADPIKYDVDLICKLYVATDIPSDSLFYTYEFDQFWASYNVEAYPTLTIAQLAHAIIAVRKEGKLPRIRKSSEAAAPAAGSNRCSS